MHKTKYEKNTVFLHTSEVLKDGISLTVKVLKLHFQQL